MYFTVLIPHLASSKPSWLTMSNRTLAVLLSCLLVTSCGLVRAQEVYKSCEYDRARLLALNENEFDQNMAGGWRALASMPGCALVAADLLHDYREVHPKESGSLFWHEAQLRANAGQYREAIALMEQAYKPAEADKAGWNVYVEATIAFLRRDRIALDLARSKLAEVQPPPGTGMPPVINGYLELEFADGTKGNIRWPPNIDVVEGLENCFDKPYAEAYQYVCRQRKR